MLVCHLANLGLRRSPLRGGEGVREVVRAWDMGKKVKATLSMAVILVSGNERSSCHSWGKSRVCYLTWFV